MSTPAWRRPRLLAASALSAASLSITGFGIASAGAETPVQTPPPITVSTPTPAPTPTPVVGPTPGPTPFTLCADRWPIYGWPGFHVLQRTPTSIEFRWLLESGCYTWPMRLRLFVDDDVVQDRTFANLEGDYTITDLAPSSTHSVRVLITTLEGRGVRDRTDSVTTLAEGETEPYKPVPVPGETPAPTPTPVPTPAPPTPTPTPVPPSPSPMPLHAPLVNSLAATSVGTNTATLCWGSADVAPPLYFAVEVSGFPTKQVLTRCTDLDGLTPNTTYTARVTGSGAPTQTGPEAYTKTIQFRTLGAPTPVPTPSPTPDWTIPTPKPTPAGPTPTPVDELIPYSYGLSGSATLKTLTKGSLPLSGGIDAKLTLPSGNFTGDLTLGQSTGKLTALGFLPVTAKVNLVSTDKVTGSLKDSKLTAVAKVRIKLPSVKALGIELAGGANCQAKQISSITLTSTQAKFMPLSGGPIAGTFSISDLSGCGFLTGIVSPLTQGAGNLIALNLSPRPYPVPTT